MTILFISFFVELNAQNFGIQLLAGKDFYKINSLEKGFNLLDLTKAKIKRDEFSNPFSAELNLFYENIDWGTSLSLDAAYTNYNVIYSRNYPQLFDPFYIKTSNYKIDFARATASINYYRNFYLLNKLKYFVGGGPAFFISAPVVSDKFIYNTLKDKISELDLSTDIKLKYSFRINKNTGKPIVKVYAIPIAIVNFLTLLSEKYNVKKYNKVIENAVKWIWENPMQTYDWSGQFEDVEANKPYQNLTKYEASWFAQYILKNFSHDTLKVKQAKELINFCEDQFVMWENPNMYDNWGNSTISWRTPSVLEQYKCYVPVDASATQMIKTFLITYNQTKEEIYFEKAKALLNSLINSQESNGKIPTFWSEGFTEFWQNCMVSDLYI